MTKKSRDRRKEFRKSKKAYSQFIDLVRVVNFDTKALSMYFKIQTDENS